jgi:hypothetical protein
MQVKRRRILSEMGIVGATLAVDLFDVFLKAFDAGKQIKKDVILKSL